MQTVVLENLSKTFSGGKKAVKDVSLSLEKGEVFGFLGPNERVTCKYDPLF